LGDICLDHLKQPKDALKAYQMLLRSDLHLDPVFQQKLKEKALKALKATKISEVAEPDNDKTADAKIADETSSIDTVKTKPKIPIQKRIKLVPQAQTPGQYKVTSVAPIEGNKVVPMAGGLDIKLPQEGPLLFSKIYAICVFKFMQDDHICFADIFVAGKSRPHRIVSGQISYSEFLPNYQPTTFENFRRFILQIISRIDSVYTDQQTINFLKMKKLVVYSDQDELELYEKNFWKHLMGKVRFQCENCWETYWIDGEKIPESGTRGTCKQCNHSVVIPHISKL